MGTFMRASAIALVSAVTLTGCGESRDAAEEAYVAEKLAANASRDEMLAELEAETETEPVDGEEPRCDAVWHASFEPSWECTSNFYEDFGGDACAALTWGAPSVRDYVMSWNEGREGFLYLSTRTDSELLLARFAQTIWVLDDSEPDDLHGSWEDWDRLRSLVNNFSIPVDAPDRGGQQAFTIAGDRDDFIELWDRYCGANATDRFVRVGGDGLDADEPLTPELEPETDAVPSGGSTTLYDAIDGVDDTQCSRASLGALADAEYGVSPLQERNASFFDQTFFHASGVVVDVTSFNEGATYQVLVVSGEAGNLNFYGGGGWTQTGSLQDFDVYGGDSVAFGEPEPGDLVLWFFDEDARTYGWASFRSPADRQAVLSALPRSCLHGM